MKDPDLLRAVIPIVEVFDELSIPYYIGGSIASSVYGMARATIDVDIVAEIGMNHIGLLKDRLKQDYYIDEMMIADAIEHGLAFNLIHLETSVKIDLFVLQDELYPRTAMNRRNRDTLSQEQTTAEVYFCTAEDIIIHKLQWYEAGGKVSERQWFDVLGVIKVQAESLDKGYLKHWAKELGISELLQKAFEEAGVSL